MSAIFLVKGTAGMSLKDMAELSTMKWGYNTRITKNLAGQKADTMVGSALLFLSLVLQIINFLWPLSWDDFGISHVGVALAVVISIVIFFIGRGVSFSFQQKWYKQTEVILKKLMSKNEK
jgi:hypothetical protein